eukprot:TRINITY_DN75693_c0_g1_i1.p1 TRINITY_DN75693_c0_g1~~TRINITY_DN75693_c0_g1_i1.p1  ORF type:complete len:462 (+),score=64.35 TRINITY_DN75693_c0_g1_i1:238-1623(+)
MCSRPGCGPMTAMIHGRQSSTLSYVNLNVSSLSANATVEPCPKQSRPMPATQLLSPAASAPASSKRLAAAEAAVRSAKRALDDRLLRLRRALAKVSSADRLSIIQSRLTRDLRCCLLRFMETQHRDCSVGTLVADSIKKLKKARTGAPPKKTTNLQKPGTRFSSRSEADLEGATSSAPPRLWNIKTRSGDYYYARFHVQGLVVKSRATCCHAEAEMLNQRLADALGQLREDRRQPLHQSERNADIANPVKSKTTLVQALSPIQEDFGLSYSVLLDARQWLGRRVQSPPLDKIEEAVRLCGEAQQARKLGWSAMRQEWLRWMTSYKWPRCRRNSFRLTEAQALARLAAAEAASAKTSMKKARAACAVEKTKACLKRKLCDGELLKGPTPQQRHLDVCVRSAETACSRWKALNVRVQALCAMTPVKPPSKRQRGVCDSSNGSAAGVQKPCLVRPDMAHAPSSR